MLALLPVVALGELVVGAGVCLGCWRTSILAGMIAWGAILVALTEALGWVHALTVPLLALGWGAVGVCLAGGLVYRRGWTRLPAPSFGLHRADLLVLVPLCVSCLALAAITQLSPPNTWDAMTYHLARLIHWQQDASLAPYPTHILRQLYLQPGAEYVLLHLHMLTGGDHLAGLVQWAAMLGSLLGVSAICGELEVAKPGALVAVAFGASIPMGVLQATSTQNDYVVSFWLISCVLFGLRSTRTARLSDITLWGAGLGLALLTKATAYAVSLPFVLWTSLVLLQRQRTRAIASLALAGGIALALNAGQFARNLTVFGTLIGPSDEGLPSLRYFNDALTPGIFLSNLLRDFGLNLVATPVVAVNVRALNFVRLVHASLGLDIQDPRSTWGNEQFRDQAVGLSFDENFAGNPLHLALLLVAFVGVWLLHRRVSGRVAPYALALGAGTCVFAAVLRWQPWGTRLELPFFALGAPVVGAVVGCILHPRIAYASAVLLVACMLPWVAYNQARPLVGPRSILLVPRPRQYFTNQPNLGGPYLQAVDELVARGCTRIGFVSNQDGWEFPLWALLRQSGAADIRIQHVLVDNVSSVFISPDAVDVHPCAVLSLAPGEISSPVTIDGSPFKPVLSAPGQLALLAVDEH